MILGQSRLNELSQKSSRKVLLRSFARQYRLSSYWQPDPISQTLRNGTIMNSLAHAKSPAKRGKSARLELLENRTLMSATWPTVDSYQQTPEGMAWVSAMTTDAAGNVYAAGRADNAAGYSTGTAFNAVVREKPSGSNTWNTIEVDTAAVGFGAIAVDGNGDLFVSTRRTADAGAGWHILERPAGQTGFVQVDQLSALGQCNGLAIDAAGNVLASGEMTESYTSKGQTYTQMHWIVRKWAVGSPGFVTVDDHVDSSTGDSVADGMTVITKGSAAGIYVVGRAKVAGSSANTEWLVRKSSDGGTTWSTVDLFTYTPSSTAPAVNANALAVASDISGNNVYVVGWGDKETITGYQGGKPIYSTSNDHWLVRKSSTGAANSWSINDDFQIGSSQARALAVGTDLAGSMYTAGWATDASGMHHDIVRSNAGGAWNTVNDYLPPGSAFFGFQAFTVDTQGNLYVGGGAEMVAGDQHPPTWIVQSTPGPVPATTGTPTTTFSSTPIASGSSALNSANDLNALLG
jgi:hypothetical protein